MFIDATMDGSTGGIAHFEQERRKKANMLYRARADCRHFPIMIHPDHRSHHNIVFEANSEAIEEQFLKLPAQQS